MRIWMVVVVVAAALLSGATVSAHEDFRVIGTLTKYEDSRVEVKARTGKVTTIRMDKQTVITRDKKTVNAAELKVGQSLVVDAYGDSEEDLLALEIRIVPPIRGAR